MSAHKSPIITAICRPSYKNTVLPTTHMPLVSVIKRSSWQDPPPEWGWMEISNEKYHWWVSSVSLIFPACFVDENFWKFPLEIILLPHSDRGLRQLLLSRTDTFASSTDCMIRSKHTSVLSTNVVISGLEYSGECHSPRLIRKAMSKSQRVKCGKTTLLFAALG